MVLSVTSRGRVIAAACLEALRAASGDDSLRWRNDCDFRRPPQNHNVDVIGCPAGVRQGTSGPTYDGLLYPLSSEHGVLGSAGKASVFAKKASSVRSRCLYARSEEVACAQSRRRRPWCGRGRSPCELYQPSSRRRRRRACRRWRLSASALQPLSSRRKAGARATSPASPMAA